MKAPKPKPAPIAKATVTTTGASPGARSAGRREISTSARAASPTPPSESGLSRSPAHRPMATGRSAAETAAIGAASIITPDARAR